MCVGEVTPTVSVVMSAYRESPSVVSEAVESILAQTFSDFEFLIALDDPSNEMLFAHLHTLEACDGRIHVYVNPDNLGLAQSLNHAISHARGKYICRMDADDIALPTRIEQQLNYLLSYDLDLVGGRMMVMGDDGRDLYETPVLPADSHTVAKALRWNNCVPHPTWLGKRSVFEHGYRTVPLCEDYDFLLRAVLRGDRLGNCPHTVLKYRMSDSSISRDNLYEQYLYQVVLTRAYKNGSVVEIGEAKSWASTHRREGASRRYSRANELFNHGLEDLRQKHLLAAAFNLASVPITSLAYLDKVFRLVMASLCAR